MKADNISLIAFILLSKFRLAIKLRPALLPVTFNQLAGVR